MARVMIIGYGPMPQPGLRMTNASALRTRQVIKPILEAGHTVFLYTLPVPGTEGVAGEVAAMTPDRYEDLAYQRFANHDGWFAIRTLTQQAEQLKPDAIIGVNTYPAYAASMMKTTIPIWADLHGYWMAEMAGRCWLEEDDARLAEAWGVERAVVRRCDKFSAVSRPQLHAVLGEMAATGRMNRHTFNYHFGCVIPICFYRWSNSPPKPEDIKAAIAGEDGEDAEAGSSLDAATAPVLRGPIVPEDAFIVLWSGGFNVWCDVDTLMIAMNRLMDRHPMVHFAATGGRSEGHANKTYERFEELLDESPHKDRFHVMGWVDSGKLPRIYREADVGINVDGANYETMFGARNRLNAMGAEGLALASTLGTEVSEWLDDGHALIGSPLGDPEALAGAIEQYIGKDEELKALGERARAIMEEDFNAAKTMQKMLAWLENPSLAPDNRAKLDEAGDELDDLNALWTNPLEHYAVINEAHSAERLHKAVVDLEAIRGKLWYRIGKSLKP